MLRHSDEFPERPIEGSVAYTAAGDEYRGAGRRRIERQGHANAQLVQSLRDVIGPDYVLPSALRLAEFEHQSAARSTVVRLVSRQNPLEIEQIGRAHV